MYCFYINKIKEVVMGRYVEEVGDRECFQILAGKPSARHPLGRPWREGNIKLGLSEVGYKDQRLMELG
jgi:hypothetical protein